MLSGMMKKVGKKSFSIILVCVTGILFTLSTSAEVVKKLKMGPAQKLIGKSVAQFLPGNHYSQKWFNDDVSSQLFHEYFKKLDPQKMYFLKSDIKEFASYEKALDDQLRRGNLFFATEVFVRFKQRLNERVEYVKKRLNEPFDFTVDESLLRDRSDSDWCESQAEMDDLWRKVLKNRLLIAELNDEFDAEEKLKEAEKEEATPKEEAAETKEVKKEKTTREKIINMYTKRLETFQDYDAMEVLESFLTTFTRIYDPHSAYMAPATEEDFDIQMKLSLQGIGARLTTDDEGRVKVTEVIAGGPAFKDGRLKSGDRIIAVAQDGEEPIDIVGKRLSKVVHYIRGAKGTKVFLTVLEAKNLNGKPVIIDIVRDEVKLTDNEAKSEILDVDSPEKNKDEKLNVLLVDLPSFYADFSGRRMGNNDYKSTTRDILKLLADARVNNQFNAMILDLRSNGGGSLDEAVHLTGLFFEDGPVVQVRQSNGNIIERVDPDENLVYDGPLVILVDHFSASASEILAAAIQDYGRGVIVGSKQTHGKGTVQTLLDLKRTQLKYSKFFKKGDPGTLKYTVAKFYRVNGGSTQVKGVESDIAFADFYDNAELGEKNLPHVLPWDEISSVKVKTPVDCRPFLPVLKKRSEQRTSNDPRFQAYAKEVMEYDKRRGVEEISLNHDVRKNILKEDEEWVERISKYGRRAIPAKKTEKAEKDAKEVSEDAPEPIDLVMDEALKIIADLTVLQKGGKLEDITPADVSAVDKANTDVK